MSIGRCPKPKDSWQGDIQFPLCKTWMKRLAENPPLTSVKEVRGQLNNLKVDEVKHEIDGFLSSVFDYMHSTLLR